jgi:hypothetical protein
MMSTEDVICYKLYNVSKGEKLVDTHWYISNDLSRVLVALEYDYDINGCYLQTAHLKRRSKNGRSYQDVLGNKYLLKKVENAKS